VSRKSRGGGALGAPRGYPPYMKKISMSKFLGHLEPKKIKSEK